MYKTRRLSLICPFGLLAAGVADQQEISSPYALYNDKKVKEYGITFEAGIPMRKTKSRISLYVDLSTRDNPDDNLPKERTISVGASLNLYDYWFLKAKYD
jgi:hypothetical protein